MIIIITKLKCHFEINQYQELNDIKNKIKTARKQYIYIYILHLRSIIPINWSSILYPKSINAFFIFSTVKRPSWWLSSRRNSRPSR